MMRPPRVRERRGQGRSEDGGAHREKAGHRRGQGFEDAGGCGAFREHQGQEADDEADDPGRRDLAQAAPKESTRPSPRPG
jgi:hypothetical protein